MLAGRIKNATRTLGKPVNWDEEKQGPCGALVIRDAQIEGLGDTMTSAWFPTSEEIGRLQAGAPVYLHLIGKFHPPVALFVGLTPEPEEKVAS